MRIPRTLLLCSLALLALTLSPRAHSSELNKLLHNAAENYEQVITELLAGDVQRSYQDWLLLAQAYLSAANKDAALSALQHAGELASNNLQKAHVLLITAKVYGVLFRDTPHAISYLQQADELLKTSVSIDEQQLYCDVLTNFAQAYNQLGDLTLAEDYVNKSLTLSISLNDQAKTLAARIMLGRLALQNNHFQRANKQLQQALVLANSLGDTDARASIHFRLGMAFRKIDEHTQALEHLQQAAELYQSLKNPSSYSYVLVYIAETYLEEPLDIVKAEQHLQQALTISQQIDNVLRTAIVKQSLGRASKLQGDNERAAQYYSEALQQFRQIGVQTFVQESALALAELAFVQQQYLQSQQIISEFGPDIDKAANYLQVRYFTLSAQLAEQQQNWQQAYLFHQQASKLHFAALTATTAEKLSVLKNHLNQSNEQDVSHSQLLTEHTQLRSHLQLWQVVAAILLLMAITTIALLLWQHWQHQKTKSLGVAFLLSRSWDQFCQRLQQDKRAKQPLQLVAVAFANSQQLKLNLGEESLRQPLQQLLTFMNKTELVACCVNSDVLWLGYKASAENVEQHCRKLQHDIQQTLLPFNSYCNTVSLQLDVNVLLGPAWQAGDVTALREAFWLSWKLATLAEEIAMPWQLQLTSNQARPCEWRSSNIRLDMINALQLKALNLSLNQQQLPASLSEPLSAEFTETR